MRAKLSKVYKALSGRDGQLVNFSAGGNPVVRTFVKPKENRTIYQTQIRDIFSQCSAAFTNLTDQQRLAWELTASEMQKTNSLNQSYNQGAKALFVSVNSYRLMVGFEITYDAPPVSLVTTIFSNVSMLYDSGSWSIQADVINDSDTVFVEISPVITSNQRHPKEKEYTLIGTEPAMSYGFCDNHVFTWGRAVENIKNALPTDQPCKVGLKLTPLNSAFLVGTPQYFIIDTTISAPDTATISGYLSNAYNEWEAEGGYLIIRNQITSETVQEIHLSEGQATFETIPLSAGTYQIDIFTTDNYRGLPGIISDLVLSPPTAITDIECYIETL